MQIQLNRNPYGDFFLFTQTTVDIKPGLTVLVGCNGSGKTTLLSEIKKHLADNKIEYVKYDNLTDGGNNAISKAALQGDYNFAANSFGASEGERITMNLSRFATNIGNTVRKTQKNELWILLDAVDSGLSVDNICELKDFLHNLVIPDAKAKGVTVYIVAAANEYEMCRGEQCLDVKHCKYVEFKDYEDYRRFILESRQIKNRRH